VWLLSFDLRWWLLGLVLAPILGRLRRRLPGGDAPTIRPWALVVGSVLYVVVVLVTWARGKPVRVRRA
jgi:hypothetical protein